MDHRGTQASNSKGGNQSMPVDCNCPGKNQKSASFGGLFVGCEGEVINYTLSQNKVTDFYIVRNAPNANLRPLVHFLVHFSTYYFPLLSLHFIIYRPPHNKHLFFLHLPFNYLPGILALV